MPGHGAVSFIAAGLISGHGIAGSQPVGGKNVTQVGLRAPCRTRHALIAIINASIVTLPARNGSTIVGDTRVSLNTRET